MQATGSLAEQWDSIADGFDELVTPLTTDVGERALGYLELDAGTRFLDVAAGTGALSLPAARAGAEVLAVDLSPKMVDGLDRRAKKAGLSNLQARVMDGTALALEDASFDVAASQNGVTLFPDVAKGLQEMVRLVRPGGRVLVSTFGPLEQAGLVHTFIEAVRGAAPQAELPSPEAPPPPFHVSDPAVLARHLDEAGLADVRVEAFTAAATFRSPEHYWKTLVHSNPIAGNVAAGLTPEQRNRALEIIEAELGERPVPGGGEITTVFHVAVGTKGGA